MAIVTQRKQIPWSWAFVVAIPWIGPAYADTVSRDPLIFTIRKHLNDPAAIAFLGSLNTLFNFAVGALAAYFSDHIWTRWGWRKPFIVVSFMGAALLLAAIPLARNVWQLAVLIALFQFFVDLARPWEALFYDVVPAPQRGRATMARMIFVQVATLFLSAVLVGQFDTHYGFMEPFGARACLQNGIMEQVSGAGSKERR